MKKGLDIIRMLMELGNHEAVSSEENLRKALRDEGCTGEEIEEALAEFHGFPLDDDDLDRVAGGGAVTPPSRLYILYGNPEQNNVQTNN